MKALVLSGGKGTRLRPITHTRAKQLIPVANKPVLFYGLEAIAKAGIKKCGIVVGDTAEEIKSAVGDGSKFGLKVEYIFQQQPLGLAHAVLVSRKFLGDEPFVMYLGDNLLKNGIGKFKDQFEKARPNSQILLVHVKNPEQFGVAELRGKKVVRLVEKPKKPKSDLALVGVYIFDDNIHKAVREIRPSFRGELEITDAIQWLIDHGLQVQYQVVEGWWKDTGKVEDLLEANRMILDEIETRIDGEICPESKIEFKVVIEKGARVKKSLVRGPAIIGQGALIENSYIGPFTAIAENCRVSHAEIEHAILMAESKIENVPRRIADSLVGRNSTIRSSRQKPEALRLIIGDSSEVDLV
jgi:glucose-1-phosphate thymidylyltransferase